jgi:hypothetical protein
VLDSLPGKPRSHEARFQPRFGLGWEMEDARAIVARNRGFLLRWVSIGAGAAVTVTGAHGLATGNDTAVEIVWAIGGPMLGMIVSHFFGPAGKEPPCPC